MGLSVLVSLIRRWWRSTSTERRRASLDGRGFRVTLGGFVLTLFLAGKSQAARWAGVTVALVTPCPAPLWWRRAAPPAGLPVRIRGSRVLLVFDVRPTVDEVLSGLGSALEATAEPVEQLGRLATAVRTGLDTRWAAVTLADGRRVVSGREDGPAALTLPVRGGLGRIECGPRDRRAPPRGGPAVPGGAGRARRAGHPERRAGHPPGQRAGGRAAADRAQHPRRRAAAARRPDRRASSWPAPPAATPRRSAHLREQARQTLQDLRELAAGIHPSRAQPGRPGGGGRGALPRLPVPTQVFARRELRAERFPDEVEGAMYFTVSEAVANALKHAGAARIEVRLDSDDGRLRARSSDDGKGFDARRAGDAGRPARRAGRRAATRAASREGDAGGAWVPTPG